MNACKILLSLPAAQFGRELATRFDVKTELGAPAVSMGGIEWGAREVATSLE